MRRIVVLLMAAVASSPVDGQLPTITRKLAIGCESCGGSDQFGSIWDVAISAQGEVLVTEKDAPMLRRFDAAGKAGWTGGRQGKGPGEFTLPIRSALTPTGLLVIDMSNNRITELDRGGAVTRSVVLTSLATTSGVNRRGEMIVGFDDMGRSFRVMAKAPGDSVLREVHRFGGSLKNKAVALGPDGSIAVVLDGERYAISRLDPNGKPLPELAREIPRPRRSAQEEAEYQRRLNRNMGMMAAEMKKAGGSGDVKPIPIPADQRGLKPHIAVDGLRFDDTGRLWVLTMHGDETKTVLDVFSAGGSYLGAVTVPMRVTSYALGGQYLVTAGENEDGIPVVTVWTVR